MCLYIISLVLAKLFPLENPTFLSFWENYVLLSNTSTARVVCLCLFFFLIGEQMLVGVSQIYT